MGKKSSSQPGRALFKARNRQRGQRKRGNDAAGEFVHTTAIEEDDAPAMGSVTERNDLEEFLATAQLAEAEFLVEKERTVVLANTSFNMPTRTQATPEQLAAQVANSESLRIPRRPEWNENMTRSELDVAERESFLEWRRKIVDIEQNENLVVTPFEKNIEVWRQLWRVTEMSDIIVQIVDSRNPLLFWCKDLPDYTKELVARAERRGHMQQKRVLMLMNKADLLNETQRQAWVEHFHTLGISFLFFSAVNEREAQEAQDRAIAEGAPVPEPRSTEEITATAAAKFGTAQLLTIDELIQQLTTMGSMIPAENRADPNRRKITIGMVGYPNVGKSTTINVLCRAKRVAESATPGKTKHFQTIHINEDLVLCDCPGLVFPSFLTTKADMLTNGIMPIDQMRDYISPTSLVCQRIPRVTLEDTYGIILPPPAEHEPDQNRAPTASELLSAYAAIRGFRTAHGSPDESRAARIVLKNYVAGKLLYCFPPPGIEDSVFNEWDKLPARAPKEHKVVTQKNLLMTGPQVVQAHVAGKRRKGAKKVRGPPTGLMNDEQFFSYQSNIVAHTKDRKGLQQAKSFTRAVSPHHQAVPQRSKPGAKSTSTSTSSSSSSGPSSVATATSTTATTTTTTTTSSLPSSIDS